MDDGNLASSGITFATHSFSYEEQELLQEMFLKRFNIETTIRKTKHKYKGNIHKGHCLYIRKKAHPIFFELIKPHMIPSFLYKMSKEYQ